MGIVQNLKTRFESYSATYCTRVEKNANIEQNIIKYYKFDISMGNEI